MKWLEKWLKDRQRRKCGKTTGGLVRTSPQTYYPAWENDHAGDGKDKTETKVKGRD
jgi:hypothetical protein